MKIWYLGLRMEQNSKILSKTSSNDQRKMNSKLIAKKSKLSSEKVAEYPSKADII
jgi:hypothetical protein